MRRKCIKQLLEDDHKVSLNTIARYRQELGLKAVLATKQVNTTIPIKEHRRYSYKLRELNISHANYVQRYLIPIKVVNTPARYIRSALTRWTSLYLWVVKAGLQVTSALSASGEASNAKDSIKPSTIKNQ